MKTLLVLILTFLASLALAQSNIFDRTFYIVTKNSEAQKLIDQAVVDIFHSKLKNDLCEVYKGPTSLRFATGISFDTAKSIYADCPEQSASSSSQTRFATKFEKSYYFSYDRKNELLIDSWTTSSGKTYFFLTKDLAHSDIKNIILHEMAISLDAKITLNFERFLKLENLPENYTNEALKTMLEFSKFQSISYSFAAMRAFKIEQEIDSDASSFSDSHSACRKRFLTIYNIFEKNYSFYKFLEGKQSTLLDLVLATSEDESFTKRPVDFDKMFKKIMDESSFVDKDRQTTFCQYMATPKLSKDSDRLFHNQGPRPRLPGGV